ncbi:MAG: hypothetical protein GF317_13820 [Candidatus Lokiarchaeota archaeon]|nr:hypothetical protein [Candidatus Lokiarchaeota archaeon]MBD3200705.1 hypothetical protein [Candidatus Lokiarchaeota archaeon]
MSHTQQIEPILFMAKWDDTIGPIIIDFYPKKLFGDMESLAYDIFQTYDYFFEHSKNPIQKTQVTLPIKNIDKKINIIFAIKPSDKNLGGSELSFISIILPSYFKQNELNIFNNILMKIIQEHSANKHISLKDFYPKILNKLALLTVEVDKEEKLDNYYSYTAAVNDFQAALKMYNKKKYDDSLTLLKNVRLKFEEENQKKLLIEVLYIIASIFAQKKDFYEANNLFKQLYELSSDVNSKKFLEISTFMLGFLNYQLENYRNALDNFKKLQKTKINYINKLNFHTLYGNACLKLKLFDRAELIFKEALKLVKEISFNQNFVNQKAQILYGLGQVYYESAFNILKQQGIFNSGDYEQKLENSKFQFKECKRLLGKLKDWEKYIKVCLILSNIQRNLNKPKLSLPYLKDAFDKSDSINNITRKLSILYKIIHIQSQLELYQENILNIRGFLDKFEDFRGLDLFNKARLYEYIADNYLSLNRTDDAEIELLTAKTLYDKITLPLYENIIVINKLIQLYTSKKDFRKIKRLSESMLSISKELSSYETSPEIDIHPLGDVREIWFFSNSSGILLFTYSPETDFDIDLIGGFLTALKQFSVELTQDEIDSMIIGSDRYSFYQDQHLDFFVLGRSKLKSSPEKVNKILKILYQRFWKEYSKEIKSFVGNIKIFDGFSNIIKNLDLTLV